MAKRVLIVSEETPQRKSLTQTLWTEGFEVVAAETSARAEEIVRAKSPDAVAWHLGTETDQALPLVELWRQDGLDFPILFLASGQAMAQAWGDARTTRQDGRRGSSRGMSTWKAGRREAQRRLRVVHVLCAEGLVQLAEPLAG